MNSKRNTYIEVNTKNIKNNINKIIKFYNNYKYYIGVVKADAYGLGSVEISKAVLAGGCNYLAVATLDEALTIRGKIKNVPILCLGVIPSKYIYLCIRNNITITIHSLLYLEELKIVNTDKLKVHLKINTGMNRLGISKLEELHEVINILKDKKIIVEGIYTHLYNASRREVYELQVERFKKILNEINIKSIKIVHISASEGITNYDKLSFVNGCRIGIIMYGFTKNRKLKLSNTFSLYSEVIQINILHRKEVVGYNALYKVEKEREKVAVVAIGYADGIIRKNVGRFVYINDKKYKIVGNICMDMLFVKVDDTVKVHDKVAILKDIKHIEEVSCFLETIPYEVMCILGKRVERRYI